MGWDSPTVSYVRQNITRMEAMPFDGLVMKVHFIDSYGATRKLSDHVFGNNPITWEGLRQSILDLRAIPFSRYKENFIRLNLEPGNVDWFENYAQILSNIRTASKLIPQNPSMRGVFLDLEDYYSGIFHYPSQPAAAQHTFAAYQAQVLRRGQEVMEALLEQNPGITIFLPFGYEKAPTDEALHSTHKYGLLWSFLDGMLGAAHDNTRIISGYANSFAYDTPGDYDRGVRLMRERSILQTAYQSQYATRVFPGFGVWMDLFATSSTWNSSNPALNIRPPDKFYKATGFALQRTYQYIWVYTQQVDWWNSINLHSDYVTALRKARQENGLAVW